MAKMNAKKTTGRGPKAGSRRSHRKRAPAKKAAVRKPASVKAAGGKAAPGRAAPKRRAARGADVKPRLVVIACNWHPLESIENAAREGFTYGPDILVLPVRCTGAVTVANILRLFAKELEGVLILGCVEGDCHYFNGSERCGEIVNDTREILEWSGVAPERLGFTLISGSEGKNFMDALGAYEKDLKRARPGRKKRVA
jgi:F420-non-reducing hydrogenase iron-sulfur subunit